ncbi:MAG: hypothetical protein L3J39_17375 [Verrucomicrobiales bacterium]|nr:hypothetical protein [Verrucomicrobiales bacterium]
MSEAKVERFFECCLRVGIGREQIESVWAVVAEGYAQEHRYYHNLSHVGKMLGWLEQTGQGTVQIELAIWFHDLVYDPSASQNEQESALAFQRIFAPLLAPEVIEDVSRLIVATDPKMGRSGADDENLLIDIDLSILGAERGDYEQYCAAIRMEYSMVSDVDFKLGREQVLNRFLSQRIYVTDFFTELEQPARENISWELGKLLVA